MVVFLSKHFYFEGTTNSNNKHGRNSDDVEQQRALEKIMCLPTCPPHSAIGISCSDLEYNIIGNQPYDSNTPSAAGTLLRKRNSTAVNGSAYHAPLEVTDSSASAVTKAIRKRSTYSSAHVNHNKKIIKGITAYFNPGQLVAIMGPSGSGKTTLLDVITARKHFKEAEV